MGYLKCCSLLIYLNLIVISTTIHETQAFKIKIPIHRLQRFHIHIVNGLAKDTLLAHCMSRNNDLGIQILSPGQEFAWTFKSSLWGNTVFHCNLRWNGGHHAFAAFDNDKRMEKMCGGKDCVWTANEDGIFIFHNRADYQFKFAWERLDINAPPGVNPGVALLGVEENKHEADKELGVASVRDNYPILEKPATNGKPENVNITKVGEDVR